MLVSVCITVYNKEFVLEQCLESIINQTYSNLEIIIIDSSTDSSWNIIQSYTIKDSRIKSYKFLSRLSPTKATQVAYDKATGKYLCSVDADDYIELNCIKECLNNIKTYDVIYTYCRWFGTDERMDNRALCTFDKDLTLDFMMAFHFRLFKKDLWLQIRPFSNIFYMWDQDLVTRLAEVGSFTLLPKIMYYWRRSDNQLTGFYVQEYKQEKKLIKRLAILRRKNIIDYSISS